MNKKFDPKLTDAMVKWLNTEHDTPENVIHGAEMLLSANRNKGLFLRISRNPMRNIDKVVYELKKQVNVRLSGMTVDDINALDNEITPVIKSAVMGAEQFEKEGNAEGMPVENPERTEGADVIIIKGKRPDHDKLPEEIQLLWQKNAERWNKIKATFELLKTLNAACDRYEHLKMLKEAWYAYRKDMNAYDEYKSGEEIPEEKKEDGGKRLSAEDQATIDNAQAFISKKLPVLIQLVMDSREPDFSDAAKLEDLRAKIQERVYSLITLGVVMTDERKADLVKCDIKVELPEDNAEGEKSE